MNMNNQKGFVNIVLIVLVVILVGAVGYFALVKKSPTPTSENQPTNNLPTQQTPPTATNNPPTTTPAPKAVDWESLLPSMRVALKQAFPNERIEESRPISIYKKVDITGDGIPEVLVNLGTGGATTDLVTSMRIESDKPIAPLFKQKDGKISTLIFSAGAGGSGRYGSTAEMLGNKNAIYSASYSKYGESADYCRVETYQWNSQTKIFEYNAVLSNEVQQDYCRTAGTGL